MSTPAPGSGTSAFAASLPGIVVGAALQLQQPSLWPLRAYVACTAAAAMVLVLVWLFARGVRFRSFMVFAAACVLSASATGWRAAAYAGSGLDASLEGRDLVLTGIVAALPHRGEAGTRFRFAPESAHLAGEEVRVPPQLLLGWYGGPESGAE